MRILLIYPAWKKLERQTPFHLPPHGPVVFAASLPGQVEVEFVDENVEEIDFGADTDLVALSVMLSCQLPRAYQISARFRQRGMPVIFGGIAAMLHAEEAALHCDSLFLGEAEGRMETVLADFSNGRLRKIYDYMHDYLATDSIGPARRDLLKPDRYRYRNVQMLDLVHASRGCRFNCFPCCTGFLGGRKFRPRPIDRVVEEMASIPNNRLFMVDNSLAQDRDWLIELFNAIAPLKKSWVSHPIMDDDEVLTLAAKAGCWYVYQAVFDTSDVIRNRIARLKDHGISVEGTIILGTDEQDEDFIKRLVDFLMEIEIDLAEFTILTPFPHSPIRTKLEQEGRILSNEWESYTADKVVFQPKRMTPEKLQEMYYYAWDTFYGTSDYPLRMGELFKKAIRREIENGTYIRPTRSRRGFSGRTNV
jgi:radical SAM superfamily enzyme YgiQ (UPF0313 family)